MQLVITRLYKSDKDKSGTPLTFKTGKNAGKTYTRLSFQAQEYGEKWLSGFESSWNQHWEEGDTVDVDVEQKGDFLNFKRVDPTVGLSLDIAKLKIDLANLREEFESFKLPAARIQSPFAKEEVNLSDIPF